MSRAVAVCGTLAFALPLLAVYPERDFSGTWVLGGGQTLTIAQDDAAIRCSLTAGSEPVEWVYRLNGDETRYKIGAEGRNSIVKWEGAALLVNTLVSGAQNYTEMDRWTLSADRTVLTIARQVVKPDGIQESTLVYRKPGVADGSGKLPVAPAPSPEPALRREPPPAAPSELVVRAGTHVALAFRNTVDTKHARDGDHIYLQTVSPVAVDGRIVIPRGSFVNGTVTSSKAAGPIKKGEIYIRFDTLILPNGVTRDFRSRMASADASAKGKVDPEQGKVTGERDSSGAGRAAAQGAGIGSIGGVMGAGAGAAAGLASVLVRHRPDVSLPQGTVVDMVLDRDLRFSRNELPF